ncbi:hypothetical protein TNCV_3976351 [Trichonephila clavipes]|nr:hypothetical protein TNCV_3976351 [Trichonephila clavipes]
MDISAVLEQLVPRHLYNKVVILLDSKAAIRAVGSVKMPIFRNTRVLLMRGGWKNDKLHFNGSQGSVIFTGMKGRISWLK